MISTSTRRAAAFGKARDHPRRLQQVRMEGRLRRDQLIASHGADYPMPNLLNHLAAPGCSKLGSHWDRCGVHYVKPIEGGRRRE